MDSESERLFLLEFLVDNVTIHRTDSLMDRLNSQNDWTNGEMCVTFQFLDYPHLEICEQDFSPKLEAEDPKASFKSGKSCLFALPNALLGSLPEEFAVNIGILRKMPVGVLPDKLLIGQTRIDLIEDFCCILSEMQCSNQECPVSKTTKDCFNVMNPSGTKAIGAICIFVRLTCFGKLIVTQFQLGTEATKSFLFRGQESPSVYQCKKMDEVDQDECVCGPCVRAVEEQMPPPPDPCAPRGGGRAPAPALRSPCNCGPSPSIASASASACDKRKGDPYEEIDAEVNGHALTIRVKKDKKRSGQVDTDISETSVADCPCVVGASKGRKDADAVEVRPCGQQNGGFCVKLPENESQLSYKLKKGAEEGDADADASQNYDKDVFVLRIGKKTEGKEQKSHLEFELKTPKKDSCMPQVPASCCQETQYLLTDLPSDDKGDKKGKGGKKGKKGKK